MAQMNLLKKLKQTQRLREQTCGGASEPKIGRGGKDAFLPCTGLPAGPRFQGSREIRAVSRA